jgi:hypothetical protein
MDFGANPSDGASTVPRNLANSEEGRPQMAIEFYSVKHRRKVQVDEGEVQKKTYERETSKGTQTRYAFQAETTVDGDKVKLTKFVGKDDYDKL